MDNRFIKNEDGTISDSVTGLIWGPTLEKEMTWDEAIKACADLEYAGHKDWRLPTVNELFSLVDRKKYNPAIDKDFFPDTKSRRYWTSETDADYTDIAWFVSFFDGDVGYDGKDFVYYYVRPVRSSQ